MKKNDSNINQNLFIKKVKSFKSKRLIQNPRKLFSKKKGEKKTNYTSLYLNQTSPYYNNTKSRFYLKKSNNPNIDYKTDKTTSPIRTTFTKLNKYRIKMNSIRPLSSSIRKLPAIINSNNCSVNFTPDCYMSLEEERLNQEKYQLNKLIKHLNKQLNYLKKENERKDVMLNNEEKELNDIIYKNNLTEEEKDLNSIIMNYQRDINYIEEFRTINNQSNSSYNLVQKIRSQIDIFNGEISEETEKIKRLKKTIIYTKLQEIKNENELIENQIKKIASLLNNSLNIKENNEKKLKEIRSFEYNIDIQKAILEELESKRKMLDKEEKDLKNNIKNIESNIDLIKKQVLKNTKELDSLRQKNKNLLNDKVINSKIIINEEEPDQNLKDYYNSKILQLKKDICFYKSKNIHNENIKTKIKEQKIRLIESLKQIKDINLPSSILSLQSANVQLKIEGKKEENINEIILPENKDLDEEKIEKLKNIYIKEKGYEKRLENKYKEMHDKLRSIYNTYNEQNKNKQINNNAKENNQETNNTKENNNNINQNELEFGIDRNNPFYTEEENNNPELDLKFNSTQYNQFTYILFKNFESKGIVSDESYNKIISPFVSFANEKKLKMVRYPSSEFDLIVEEFTKIILEVLNYDNKYNHSLTKIFLSALLINSGCDIQKMVEYFAILFSYTRDYKTDEEKFLKKLKNLYTKEVKEISISISNYIEKTKNEEKYGNYFPLIKLKEIIEENHINLKDKYVEFLFYYLKQFDDTNAKLDYLQISKLNNLLEDNQKVKQEFSVTEEEEEKKLNTEPNKKERFDNYFKQNNKDNNINNEEKNKEDDNNEGNKTDDSATEITIDEYLKQLKGALDLIKKALKSKNISFKNIVEEKKKVMKSEGEKIEYIDITDLNNKLRSIGVILSDLKLSCICSKYSLKNDLKLINIKSLEEDLNSE